MKNTIINTLILILTFNIMMIILPEGKTQKFCRLIIKIFIIIVIINNIFLNESLYIYDFVGNIPENEISYEREINIKNVDKDFINSLNEKYFDKEEVINDIVLNFTDQMGTKAIVTLNRYLDNNKKNNLIKILSEVLKIDAEKIDFR